MVQGQILLGLIKLFFHPLLDVALLALPSSLPSLAFYVLPSCRLSLDSERDGSVIEEVIARSARNKLSGSIVQTRSRHARVVFQI